jgi:hypothetical protein
MAILIPWSFPVERQSRKSRKDELVYRLAMKEVIVEDQLPAT